MSRSNQIFTRKRQLVKPTVGSLNTDISKYIEGRKISHSLIRRENGCRIFEWKNSLGKLDSIDGGPAVVILNKENQVIELKYLKNGELYHPYLPAVIKWHGNGNLSEQVFYTKFPGQIHQDGGPALEKWYDNGQVMLSCWYKDNRLYSPTINGQILPAEIEYCVDGAVYRHGFRLDGLLHSFKSQPSNILYFPDGSLYIIEYHKMGKLHRLDGPAMIDFSSSGKIINELHYIDGRRQYLPGSETGFDDEEDYYDDDYYNEYDEEDEW